MKTQLKFKNFLLLITLSLFLVSCVAGGGAKLKRPKPSTAKNQPFAPPYDCLIAQKPFSLDLSSPELDALIKKKDPVGLTMWAAAIASGTLKGKKPREAIKLYRILSKTGNAYAQFELGAHYRDGKYVPKDYKKARELFEKSAASGYCLAQHELGLMYEKGLGVPVDNKKMIDYYQKAATQGLATSLFEMGHIYGRNGTPIYLNSAVQLFHWAADQGHAPSMYAYGHYLIMGKGVPVNKVEGAKWIEKAADKGEKEAMFENALNYLLGEGVKKNFPMGAGLMYKAATSGSSNAQYYVWLIFKNPKDKKTAFNNLVKSAKQGNPNGMLAYGQELAKNKKSSRKQAEAYKWIFLAKKSGLIGSNADKPLADLTAKLSKSQIAKGKKMAANWKNPLQ